MKARLFTAVFLFQLCLAPGYAAGGSKAAPGYNVVLVLMETLRPDHLGCYGYGRATSPNLDKLAAGSAVFENAFAQSSQSLISAASVFTGLYPPSHGVTRADKRLDPGIPTLAGELKKHGYRTAAFTSGFFLNHSFGLNSGFEKYDDSKDFGTLNDVVPGALAWLGANKDKKFFLVVHGYDAHAPYRAPAEFLSKFSGDYSGQLKNVPLDYNLADRIYKDGLYEDYTLKKRTSVLEKADTDFIVSQYDGAVLYADLRAGDLLRGLEGLGLSGNTVVLFLSSAGEALMDHGTILSSFHGGLYEEGIHVPLMIRAPGVKPARIKAEVQLVDVLPTVLDLLGFAAPAGAQGISLKPALLGTGTPAERPVFAQTLSLKDSAPYIGLRAYPLKLTLEGGRYTLYDLASDPREQADVSVSSPAALGAMRSELDLFVRALPRRTGGPGQRPLAIVAERMKALGYWWVDRPRLDHWAEQRGEKGANSPAKK
jgi:arylsulfatase A-like enzyme